jgi:UDP-glucuronate 4-epimerase
VSGSRALSRVLVTGGAGAIGSWLVDALLERGSEVAVLDSFHEFYPRARKERNLARARANPRFAGVFEGDIRDGAFTARAFAEFAPSAVAHLAARAGVRPSIDDPVTYADVNLTGTSVVLNAAARAGVERLVFASSSSVYGEQPRGEFTEELAANAPMSPYGASKRGGELLCHAAWATTGLPVTCLRFFNAYGPRMRPDLALHKFAKLMLAGKPLPIFGDGSAERDLTFVSETVDGIVAALERARGFHIYNLGRGKPVNVNDIVAALERALGRSARRESLPLQLGDLPRTWASTARAQAELDYAPKIDLDEGVARFVTWLREEGECESS